MNRIRLLSLFAFLLISLSAYSKIIYVDHRATDGNKDGTSWTHAYTDLKTAMDASLASDTIVVASGTYVPSTTDAHVSFVPTDGTVILGGFTGEETKITSDVIDSRDFSGNETILSGDRNGNDNYGSFPYSSSNISDNSNNILITSGVSNQTVIDGFTIMGGNADSPKEGGGIYNILGEPVIRNCYFKYNYAEGGGGAIYNAGEYSNKKDMTLINVSFYRNITDDSFGGGGAIFNYYAKMHIDTARFEKNYAYGGVSGSGGGAMRNEESNVYVKYAAFVSNFSFLQGGAVNNRGGYGLYSYCTFYKNSVNHQYNLTHGGAISNLNSGPPIENCIFWGNTSHSQLDHIYTNNGYTTPDPVISYCNIEGSTSWDTDMGTNGGNNIDADPMFFNPAAYDVRLSPGSPSIGTGVDGSNMGYYQGSGALPPAVSITGGSLQFEKIHTGELSGILSYLVEGDNLTESVKLTAPEGFEVSLQEGESFIPNDIIYLSPDNGSLSQTVYVRFAPVSPGNYVDSIKHSSGEISDEFIKTYASAVQKPEFDNRDMVSGCQDGSLVFNISFQDEDPASVSLEAQSDKPGLIPLPNINITGSTSERTVEIIPAEGQSGLAKLLFIATDSSDLKDTLSVEVLINETYSINQTATICDHDSLYLEGSYRKTAGTYYDTLVSSTGCDSIIVTELNILPSYQENTQVTLCSGDSVFLEGEYQKETGIFYDTFVSTTGCDSIIITELTVNPSHISNEIVEICEGDSIYLEQQYRKVSGIFKDTLQNQFGCDSIIVTEVVVNPRYLFELSASLCEGDSLLFNGSYYKESGIYFDSLMSITGCDSIYILNLQVNPVTNTQREMNLCMGDSVFLEGAYRKTEGIYFDTLTAETACDSIVETTLTFSDKIINNITTQLCQGETIDFNEQLISDAGVYYDTLSSKFGCDSIVINEVLLIEPPVADLPETVSFREDESTLLTASEGFAVYEWNEDPTLSVNTMLVDGQETGPGEFMYTLYIEDSHGCFNHDTTLVQVQTIISDRLSENPAMEKILVYPNPVEQEFLNIDNQGFNINSIYIYDITGSVVSTLNPENEKFLTIPFDVNEGIYFVRFNLDEGYKIVKVIKQ